MIFFFFNTTNGGKNPYLTNKKPKVKELFQKPTNIFFFFVKKNIASLENIVLRLNFNDYVTFSEKYSISATKFNEIVLSESVNRLLLKNRH